MRLGSIETAILHSGRATDRAFIVVDFPILLRAGRGDDEADSRWAFSGSRRTKRKHVSLAVKSGRGPMTSPTKHMRVLIHGFMFDCVFCSVRSVPRALGPTGPARSEQAVDLYAPIESGIARESETFLPAPDFY